MHSEIIINIPQQDVIEFVDDIVKDLQIQVRVLDVSFEEAVTRAKEMILPNPDVFRVIVSGGVTSKLLQKAFPEITFVNYDPAEYDIIVALKQARMLGNLIGLFHGDYKKLVIMEQLSEAFGLAAKGYVYSNGEEFRR